MCEVPLELEKLRLSLVDEGIQLVASTSVGLRSSDPSWSYLSSNELFETLVSGNVWVSRGRGCYLELKAELDDCPLNEADQPGTLDTIGRLLQDAPFWNTLGLRPTLQTNDFQYSDLSDPGIIIKLHYELPGDSQIGVTDLSRSISSESTTVKGLSSIDLEKITIMFSYHSTSPGADHPPKRRKLSFASTLVEGDKTGNKAVVTSDGIITTQHTLLDKYDGLNPHTEPGLVQTSHDWVSSSWGGSLFWEDHQILKNQLLPNANLHDSSLIRTSGYFSTSQSSLKDMTSDDCNNAIGLTNSRESSEFNIISAYTLMETALRHIIGGQQLKRSTEVRLRKPYPKYALCDICPSMWSPGFLQSISLRSRLTPKIANILSVSVRKNAQSPSLQRKLEKVRFLRQQASDDARGGSTSRVEPSSQTIEAQLVKMMRLSLYNPKSARHLPPSAVEDVDGHIVDMTKDFDSEEDLEELEGMYGEENYEEHEDWHSEDMLEDIYFEENEEFEDLLGDEEGGGRHISTRNKEASIGSAPDSIFTHERSISTAWPNSLEEWEDEDLFDELEEHNEGMLI